MPVPSAAQIESLAKSALQSAGLEGEDASKLATALGDLLNQVLTQFTQMTQVLPGIPAAVDPISGSGATAGPGMLLPPPGGGPGAAQIEGLASTALQGAGLEGEYIPDLAAVLGDACEIGLTLFCAQVMVAPGIAVAGMVTSAPGSLM